MATITHIIQPNTSEHGPTPLLSVYDPTAYELVSRSFPEPLRPTTIRLESGLFLAHLIGPHDTAFCRYPGIANGQAWLDTDELFLGDCLRTAPHPGEEDTGDHTVLLLDAVGPEGGSLPPDTSVSLEVERAALDGLMVVTRNQVAGNFTLFDPLDYIG
jgi:hypothetical protein